MTCRYLVDGQCVLAESVGRRALGRVIQCRPDEATCQQCLAHGTPIINRPPIQVLLQVRSQVTADELLTWVKFNSPPARHVSQKPPPNPNVDCAHRGEIIGSFSCGCAGGGQRHIYACPVAGKCCLQAEHVERAVVKLRQSGLEKAERKVRACEGCPEATVVVQLDSQSSNAATHEKPAVGGP